MILTIDFIPDRPHKSLCGKCDICIDHCPTKAIVEPFVIQSNLCIAYHTIENRDENIPKKIDSNEISKLEEENLLLKEKMNQLKNEHQKDLDNLNRILEELNSVLGDENV